MCSKKIHFETLGCRLNQDESEGAARAFINQGYDCSMEAVTSGSTADSDTLLCVINTCTVTNKAEQKARRIIRLCLEKYPLSKVCVTGCYAELDGKKIKDICPERICIIPGTKKYLLKELSFNLKNLFSSDKKSLDIKNLDDFIKTFSDTSCKDLSDKKSAFLQNPLSLKKISSVSPAFTLYTPLFEKHSRASLKIQDGCNNSCTFCRIHFARGKAVSLDVEEVLKRVKELEAFSKEEVVFTGVNLSQYAGDFFDGKNTVKKDFAFLLDYLIKNTKSIKFRISSFYPQAVTEKLAEILESDRVQPFFHLSVQSGSNCILKAMKRPYGNEEVINAVKKIRKAKKDCFISCDIIAGFPGESESDFNDTVRLCKECSFSWIHVFPYSVRPGTEAALMKNQIAENVKRQRAFLLNDIAVKSKIDYIKSMQEKVFNAVIENSRALRLMKNKEESSLKTYHAVTENFIHVEFKSEKILENSQSVKLKIERVLEENIKNSKEIEALALLV